MDPPALDLTAPDGSPVSVFAALPAGSAPAMIDARLPRSASVLDLGCGAGRLAKPLVELGHRVTGVDLSPEMLACLDGRVRTVTADIATLDLGPRFDAVILASYLVNHSFAAEMLASCRRHVSASGQVFVQRYDPLWLREATPDAVTVGNVTVSVDRFVPGPEPGHLCLTVTYRIDSHEWVQPVEALIRDDDDLDALADDAGLSLGPWLDEHRTWAVLRPRPVPLRST